ncbi:zinc-binding protein A33-like [Brachionichthys hirsutus]|uniref:zinc-binding protein A33-like n=1 Tax=Brachionichthys hirsutus TaxID=412623 RepID=UPI0036049828
MASSTSDKLCCPVCHDIFRAPVVLSCCHSFCQTCVQSWWRTKQSRECPVCRAVSSTLNPPISLVLKDLCEAFLLEGDQEALCPLHSEKLKLYCMSDQQLACLVCRESEKHANHRFRPIDEAVQQGKEKLQREQETLKVKLKDQEDAKKVWDQTAEHIKVQASNTRKQITEQFQKFHQLLREEENQRLGTLQAEEQQKSQRVMKNIEDLERNIAALSEAIAAVEDKLKAGDISFLLNCNALEGKLDRAHSCPTASPQLPKGLLIEEAKHLGNMPVHVWSMMEAHVAYDTLVLDPNTACPKLLVSEDLISVKRVEELQLPDNPERFDTYPVVLSSVGFSAGSHSWAVDVGDSAEWLLGVLPELMQRKGYTGFCLWGIGLYNGVYRARSQSVSSTIQVTGTPRRIMVDLDLDQGKLSFIDMDTESFIHTFSHNFEGKMIPYVSANNLDVLSGRYPPQ